jgi:hypothetical protein
VPAEDISTSIREFIARFIRSVEQLEILILFSKDPSVTWSAQKVYDTILSTPQSVQRWLDDLVRDRLLEKLPGEEARYRCGDDEALLSQVTELAELYRTKPVGVIETIYRREANAARSFADAFRIKKPD